MSLLLLLSAVVAVYFVAGTLRWDHEAELRVGWPRRPSWWRWRISLRSGRVLQCGQCWPGGAETVAAPVPFFVTDDLKSVAAGASLTLAPELDRCEGPSASWDELTVRSIPTPVPCVELAMERTGPAGAGRGFEPLRLFGSEAVRGQWSQLPGAEELGGVMAWLLDVARLQGDVEAAREESRSLSRLCLLVALFWFVLVPLAALLHFAVSSRWPLVVSRDVFLLGLGVGYLLLLSVHHLIFWRLASRWFPRQRWRRVGQLVMHTVSPADAMLCLGPLFSQRVTGRHPVTQALAAGEDPTDVSSRLIRSLAASRGSGSRLTVEVRRHLTAAGVSWHEALEPPQRESEASRSWCPVCLEQSTVEAGDVESEAATCADCRGVVLRGFAVDS